MTLAALFRRFEFELFDTICEHDADTVRESFLGEPMLGSHGVRMRVTSVFNQLQ